MLNILINLSSIAGDNIKIHFYLLSRRKTRESFHDGAITWQAVFLTQLKRENQDAEEGPAAITYTYQPLY